MSLRLVDAELDFLVAGSPNTRYVALSYVLGQRQNIENDLGMPSYFENYQDAMRRYHLS